MKIKVNPFSVESIDRAIAELDEYIESLDAKTNELTRRLTDMGVLRAMDLVTVYSGEALNSIHGYIEDSGKGIIVADGHCIYIEFGTGVKGEGNPHPSQEWLSFMNWIYGSGGTIFTTKSGKTGWYYPVNEERTEWRFTQGIESNPFMYNTVQYLKEELNNVAKEVFTSDSE